MAVNIGTTLAIATGTPATEDSSGYSALSFVTIEGVLSIPAFGDTSEFIKSNILKTGRTSNDKGTKTLGDLTIPFEEISPDAGMDDVRAAALTNSDYSFKITYASGAIRYFYGLVGNLQENEASTSTKAGGSFVIAANSGEVIV